LITLVQVQVQVLRTDYLGKITQLLRSLHQWY